MQIKIPGTTLKKIGQEEAVWLCLSPTENMEDFLGWSSHEVAEH